jgi:hypothetical protein
MMSNHMLVDNLHNTSSYVNEYFVLGNCTNGFWLCVFIVNSNSKFSVNS